MKDETVSPGWTRPIIIIARLAIFGLEGSVIVSFSTLFPIKDLHKSYLQKILFESLF